MATRQEIIIKCAKINRFVRQLDYWSELNMDMPRAAYDRDLFHIDQWAADILAYISEDADTPLLRQVHLITGSDAVAKYLEKRGMCFPPAFRSALKRLVPLMRQLYVECESIEKGSFQNLVPELANAKAADLLGRAVNAGLLDENFLPSKKATMPQLKVVAYAVSQLLGFSRRHRYVSFDRQWHTEHHHLAAIMLPRDKKDEYQAAMNLYDGVDFSEITASPGLSVFYSPYDEATKRKLYRSLLKNRYIAEHTTLRDFMGIFDADKFRQPVEWTAIQRQLAYFAKQTLEPTNKKNLWIKCETCFTIEGKKPHRGSLNTGYSQVERGGFAETYDTVLKGIADEYNAALPLAFVAKEATDTIK